MSDWCQHDVADCATGCREAANRDVPDGDQHRKEQNHKGRERVEAPHRTGEISHGFHEVIPLFPDRKHSVLMDEPEELMSPSDTKFHSPFLFCFLGQHQSEDETYPHFPTRDFTILINVKHDKGIVRFLAENGHERCGN
jgi:hypothetical protein